MPIDRREFMAASAAVGVAGAMAPVSALASESTQVKQSAQLRLSCQEWIMPDAELRAKVELMQKWGFAGIELGGKGLDKRVRAFKDALKGTDVGVSAICAGYEGAPISDDPDVRRKMIASAEIIVKAAGELGSTGLIIVPAFNGQTKLGHVEGRKLLVEDVLPKLGDAAQAAGTRILLEPLNRKEAWFLRQVADAAKIAQDVDHPAVCVMGDFYHMYWEEPCDMAAFMAGGDLLHHVHFGTGPNRILPGQEEHDFRRGFKGLKAIGYQDYCSLECGCEGDKMVEIPKCVEFLKRQWSEA